MQEFLCQNSERNGCQKEINSWEEKRGQKQLAMFMARHEITIEFLFCKVSDAELFFFLEGLDLKTNIAGAEKGNNCCKEDFSTKGIDNKQQKNHVIFEQNLEKEQRKHDLITNTSSDYERKA